MLPKSTLDTWIQDYYEYRRRGYITPKDRAKKWKSLLPKLKKKFEAAGITRCEVCRGAFALGFAHRYKRRFITTMEELETVALLCVGCHEQVEHSGRENMYERITEIIERRSVDMQF
ncbi:MAG: hypothetical protein KF855_03190 [Acidobacteria bacterium]|nr:hypothetical protein [Acidobacteriota bacterium]